MPVKKIQNLVTPVVLVDSLTGEDVSDSIPLAVKIMGVIPDPSSITNSMLAQMPPNTIKGNNTGVDANPLDLTTTEVTAMLEEFSGSSKGLVPEAVSGDETKYLKGDGTWAEIDTEALVPAGGTTGQVLAKNSNADYDTEWVDQSGGGGTPGGSDTQVQFNDGGAFGGDDKFLWDKTTESLNVQTTLKQHALHVAGKAGQGIADVTVASASLVDESIDASPTGVITPVAQFPTPSGCSVNQNTGGGGFTANGQTFTYKIYPVIFSPIFNQYYVSANSDMVSYTDTINDGTTQFSNTISFPTADTYQTHWFIEREIDSGGFTDSIIVATTGPWDDSAYTGTQPGTPWPTTYLLSYTVPTAPNSLSLSPIDVGSGNLTATGLNYNVEIRSATLFGGVYYCETSGTSGSYTDPNDSSTFNLDMVWTAGACDDQVVRISTDAGSTWVYLFVGSNSGAFVYNGQGNDTIAEAAWSNSFAGLSATYSFKAFGKSTSPSGNTVYAPTAIQYSHTITTPNVPYVFIHAFTGMPSGGARVVGNIELGISHGQDVSGASFFDPGYFVWSSGVTVTPNSYGFSGTAQNREYKLYGYSGTLLIYSATALTLSTSASSGNKYVSGTFSYPSGITTVKITRGINGASHNVSKTFNSPTASFTDDTTDTTWNGNTTVTPTAAVPTAVRFDYSRIAIGQAQDNLSIVDITGSGDRFPSIGFGVANSEVDAVTTQARIGLNVVSGALLLGATRVNGYTNATLGSLTWQLGLDNSFNLGKSSTVHTTIWGGDASVPLMYAYSAGDGNRGTAYFGQQSVSFGTGSKLVIAPTSGGTIALHIRRTAGASAAAILIDENGSFRGEWNSDGRMALGVTGVAANVQLVLGATTNRAQIRFNDLTTDIGSPQTGDVWRVGGVLKFRNASSQTTTLCPVLTATATLNFPNISPNSIQQLTMTVTGATVGDAVFIGLPNGFEAGLLATGFVSAANTVAIRLHNTSGGSVDPASATFRAVVARL